MRTLQDFCRGTGLPPVVSKPPAGRPAPHEIHSRYTVVVAFDSVCVSALALVLIRSIIPPNPIRR